MYIIERIVVGGGGCIAWISSVWWLKYWVRIADCVQSDIVRVEVMWGLGSIRLRLDGAIGIDYVG